MVKLRILAKLFLASSCLLFVACGCVITSNMVNFWPLLYKPSCDVQPVLAIQMPNYIKTLAACPKDQTLTLDGGTKDGFKWPDDIKEFFYYRNGKGESGWDVEYAFRVFFTEAAAVKWYDSNKRRRSKDCPVFREMTGDCGIACVYYTKQERADPEGGSGPMGIYHARASFRLRNTHISITTNERSSKSDKLELATKELAQMLRAGVASTNRLSQ